MNILDREGCSSVWALMSVRVHFNMCVVAFMSGSICCSLNVLMAPLQHMQQISEEKKRDDSHPFLKTQQITLFVSPELFC